jgi:putative addiction module component (TIGR02574 family)
MIMPTAKGSSRRKSRKRLLETLDYRSLTVSERLYLAQEILGSIAEEQECPPMSDEEKAIIDHRLDAFHASPYEGDSWEDLKKKLLKK